MPRGGQKTERCADEARIGTESGLCYGETYLETSICCPILLGCAMSRPAIAHLSPFWPRALQIARKRHTWHPATQAQGVNRGRVNRGRRCVHGDAPRCRKGNVNAPPPAARFPVAIRWQRRMEESYLPELLLLARNIHQVQLLVKLRHAPTFESGHGRSLVLSSTNRGRITEHPRRASYSKNLATPTGMHWRMRPTSSAFSNQWRVQPAQPFEKNSRQNSVSPSSSAPCTRTRAPNASRSA